MQGSQILNTPDVKVAGEREEKREAKSRKLLFVEYFWHHEAYRFMDPSNGKSTAIDFRFLSKDEVRNAKLQQRSIVD